MPMSRARSLARRLAAALGVALAATLAFGTPALAYTQREQIVSSGHGSISPSYLVIHDTDNPGASAWNHVCYWRDNNVPMAHYVMSTDGHTVYHTQRDDTLAWQVGYGNRYCVGIELCYATSRADFLSQWDEAAQWAADYLNSRGWGIDHMISHSEASGRWGGSDHTDPVPYFRRYGRTWAEFKADVASRMRGGGSTVSADTGLGDTSWTGPRMVAAWQSQLGTPSDGEISGQAPYNANSVQWAITVSPATRGGRGSQMVVALQRFLVRRGYGVGASGADGHMGRDTVRALQRFLNDEVGAGLDVDGWYGHATSRAVGTALQRGLFGR